MNLMTFLRRIAFSSAVIVAINARIADAGLVYWQNFDGGNGGADSPVNIGGNLGITNGTSATTSFNASPSGTLFGGAYDATSNASPGASTTTGIASTLATGGSALNLGTLSQMTVTMWVKTQAFSATNDTAARLLVFGPSSAADFAAANSFSVLQYGSVTSGSAANKFNVSVGASDPTPLLGSGTVNSLNEWTFIAVTYDGTSLMGNNSSVQLTATGSSQVNGQFYRGTVLDAVVRFDAPFTAVNGDASASSVGPLAIGSSGVLMLGNRNNRNRGFDGLIDDVRIYNNVLSAAEVEEVRQFGPMGVVPEPSTFALVGSGLVGLAAIARRLKK